MRQPVPEPDPLTPTSLVAVVNGAEITAQELDRQLGILINSVRNRVPPEQLAQLGPRFREQALNQLIVKRLLIEEVDKQKIETSADELAEARAKIEATLPEGMTLTDVLAQRNVSAAEFDREFKDEFRINKLIELQTTGATNVSDEETKAFYQENPKQFTQPETATARHILIGIEPGDSDEAKAEKKAKAEKVREQLLAGADFAKTAATESSDPGSKDTGGVYTFPRGQMVPAFEEAAFSQPIGEIGPLVETRFGYHIIKVDERKEASNISLEEVQTNLVQYLRMKKVQAAAQIYVEGLRSNAQVNVLIK
jgi:peptidyl-prolyl cis-trans isomerase C